jgi:hypothetical protein
MFEVNGSAQNYLLQLTRFDASVSHTCCSDSCGGHSAMGAGVCTAVRYLKNFILMKQLDSLKAESFVSRQKPER